MSFSPEVFELKTDEYDYGLPAIPKAPLANLLNYDDYVLLGNDTLYELEKYCLQNVFPTIHSRARKKIQRTTPGLIFLQMYGRQPENEAKDLRVCKLLTKILVHYSSSHHGYKGKINYKCHGNVFRFNKFWTARRQRVSARAAAEGLQCKRS